MAAPSIREEEEEGEEDERTASSSTAAEGAASSSSAAASEAGDAPDPAALRCLRSLVFSTNVLNNLSLGCTAPFLQHHLEVGNSFWLAMVHRIDRDRTLITTVPISPLDRRCTTTRATAARAASLRSFPWPPSSARPGPAGCAGGWARANSGCGSWGSSCRWRAPSCSAAARAWPPFSSSGASRCVRPAAFPSPSIPHMSLTYLNRARSRTHTHTARAWALR